NKLIRTLVRPRLNLTKLDILDTFSELRIATSYTGPASAPPSSSGASQPLESFPASLPLLSQATVNYATLPGWNTSTTGAKRFADLPVRAQEYVKFIEDFVGVPVRFIGTGPGREAMIDRAAE
ncbi:MAG: hypothetical protein M1838_005237, partial [Thelocarpon superellum]